LSDRIRHPNARTTIAHDRILIAEAEEKRFGERPQIELIQIKHA